MKRCFIRKWILSAVVFSSAIFFAFAAQSAAAGAFPERNIVIVLGNSAGSGGDLFCRAVAQAANGHPLLNGHSIIVENRTGASGTNAMNYVKNARPDGYNILNYTVSLTVNELINDIPVHMSDFLPLCSVVEDTHLLVVRSDSQWKTLQELVADGVANPRKQIWARGLPSGSDTVSQLIFLSKVPGLQVRTIPYDGGGEAMTALLGGHVDLFTAEYLEAKPQFDAGKFRALAALSEKRLDAIADIPTAKEQGYDAVLFRPRGFFLPKGTPPEVVETLLAIFKSVTENENFVKTQNEGAASINFMTTDEWGKAIEDIRQSYIDADLKGLVQAELQQGK
jgi:tripartite-type tricarboxylate transporter receptor subunit TctC